MGRSLRFALIALTLVAITLVAIFAFLRFNGAFAHVGPKPLSDLKVAEAWLQCIDCRGPFLRHIANLPDSSTDTVVAFLSTSLLDGPDSERIARRQHALMRTWRADSIYLSRRGQAPAIPADSFVRLYRRGFEVMWRSRAATALGVIRGDVAMAALDSALELPVTDVGDSTIKNIVDQAIADSALEALSGTLPRGGTQTGEISGRVVDNQGVPLAGIVVTLAGFHIGEVTGNDGQFTLRQVPPGSHTLHLRRIGNPSQTATATVTVGRTTYQDFTFQP